MPYGTGCGSIRTLPGLVSPVAGARTAANRAPAAIFPRDSPLFPLYDCQMIVPPSSDDNLMFVRDQLGIACLAWVVGDIAQSPSEKQAATIDVLASQIRDAIGTRPDLPLSLVVSHMASSFIPAIGNTLLNQLKEETSPYQEPLPHTDDNTLNAFRALARAVYCQLLLPLIRHDDTLPSSEALGPEAGPVTEFLDGFFERHLVETLLLCAWEYGKLTNSVPTIVDLFEHLEVALQQARDAFAGKVVNAVSLASLSGVVLPDGTAFDTPWGRIRAAPQSDYPGAVRFLRDHRTTGGHAGEQVTISDAGEVIVEVSTPLQIDFKKQETGYNMTTRPKQNVEARILEARLALLLSSSKDYPLVVLSVWHRMIDPVIAGGRLLSWANPEGFAPRTPTALSAEDIDAWKSWIRTIDGINLGKLGVAPARLLRAVAERRDREDALVDAVIAWEALFGADQEISFKISSSIARLLRSTPSDRKTLRKRASEIYGLRSKVVHGANVNREDVENASLEAITIGTEILRTMIKDRPELVAMSPGERIVAILME